MSAENVSFYARLKEVQELQHKREQKRIDLQRKFDSYVTSDHHLSRLRASRLQSYWKSVCENERKSRARNEQLLRDFERVEAHMATLASRTQRLKLLKNQYEHQVEEMYPYWKEQMEIKRQSQMKREHRPADVPVSASVPHGQRPPEGPQFAAQRSVNGKASIFPGQQYPEAHSQVPSQQYPEADSHVPSQQFPEAHSHVPSQQYPEAPSHVHIPQHSSALYQQPPLTAQSNLPGSYLESRPSAAVVQDQESARASQQMTAPGGYLESYREAPGGRALLDRGRLPSSLVAQGRGAAGTSGQAEDSTTFSISSDTPSSPSHKQKQGVTAAGLVQSAHPAQSHVHSRDLQPNQVLGEPPVVLLKDVEKGSLQEPAPPSRGNPILSQDPRRGSVTGSLAGASDKAPSGLTEPFSSGDEHADHLGDEAEHALYSPEVPPALPKYEEGEELPVSRIVGPGQETVLPVGPAPGVPQVARPSDSSGTSGSEEDSELDSDVSLPLSDDDAEDTGVKPTPAAEDRLPSMTKAETRTSDIHQIPVSLDGFWLLLKAVEAEIDETDTLEGIYASLPCTKTIRDEIVRTANSKSGFERLDPRAISMVILEELPLLVRKLPGGCLLSERLLIASSRTITEVSIRSHMYSSALAFWDSILHHMVFLVRRGVMEPEAVARKFAPLLVAAESRATDKAVTVMSDILMKAEEEEELTLGDESSLTATSPLMSPENPTAATPAAQNGNEGGKPGDHPSVPPLALGGMEGDTDDLVDTGRASTDGFFDSKVPLTETDAYQRMMMSSQPEKRRESLGATGGDDDDDDISDDDDDSEDEIERAARIGQDSPSSQQPKKKRNVLSSLGGSLGGRSLEDADDNDDGGGEMTGGRKTLPLSERSDEVSSPDKSDLTSSLSPTPRGAGTTGGYVPSAMEQSMKSTGRSDLMNRSAAFWGNESDLEEESDMSVPMGTGKVDDEKDDFDFYD